REPSRSATINQRPVSRSVQRKVMQLAARVPLDYGVFETTKFEDSNNKGVDIILKFHPDETKVDAKKIAISQAVNLYKASGTAYAPSPNLANRMVPGGQAGAGFILDASPKSNNPI